MEKDWVLVYTLKKEYIAVILKEVFDNDSINCVMIDKTDSSYAGAFSGFIEVYVHKDDELKAKEIVREFEEGAEK